MCFHLFILLNNFLLDSFKVARFAISQKLTYKYTQKHPQSMKNNQLKNYENYKCLYRNTKTIMMQRKNRNETL